MKKSKENLVLKNMLKQTNERLNIYYLTTDSRFYRVVKTVFYVLFGICAAINLLCIISWSASLNTDLSYIQNPTSYQQSLIAEIKDGIKTVSLFGFLLIGAPIFSKLKKSIPALIFTLFPSFILLLTFSDRLSKNIDAGNLTFFAFVHLIPICLLCVSQIILSIIEINQRRLDKKVMDIIATKIYEKWGTTTENISEEQWKVVLSEFNPIPSKSEKRKRKTKKTEETTAETKV